MKTNIILVIALLVVGAAGAFAYLKLSKGGTDAPAPAAATSPVPAAAGEPADHAPGHAHGEGEWCAGHQIAEAECPWCMPSLIEKLGHCAEHDVAEALCSRCNPKLIPGFKAENDWCAGHGLPESQCKLCQAGHLPPDEQG